MPHLPDSVYLRTASNGDMYLSVNGDGIFGGSNSRTATTGTVSITQTTGDLTIPNALMFAGPLILTVSSGGIITVATSHVAGIGYKLLRLPLATLAATLIALGIFPLGTAFANASD